MNSQSIRVSPAVALMFQQARGMGRVEGHITSNVEYIQYLEYGTAKMAAHPMIGPYLAEYQEMIHEELVHAVRQYAPDMLRAAQAGISMATLRIMRAIADRTAVDTGRAKGSWTAILPDGTSRTWGTVMTAEQQRLIIKNRSTKQRAAAKAARTKNRYFRGYVGQAVRAAAAGHATILHSR